MTTRAAGCTSPAGRKSSMEVHRLFAQVLIAFSFGCGSLDTFSLSRGDVAGGVPDTGPGGPRDTGPGGARDTGPGGSVDTGPGGSVDSGPERTTDSGIGGLAGACAQPGHAQFVNDQTEFVSLLAGTWVACGDHPILWVDTPLYALQITADHRWLALMRSDTGDLVPQGGLRTSGTWEVEPSTPFASVVLSCLDGNAGCDSWSLSFTQSPRKLELLSYYPARRTTIFASIETTGKDAGP
jgi:hypothetical protein